MDVKKHVQTTLYRLVLCVLMSKMNCG